MARLESLSAAQARRLAIAAQGLTGRQPASVDRRQLRGVLRRTGLLQIDSVNVLARAHYLPAFSRLGGYPTGLLDRMAYRERELFEYWGHEAALLPVELHRLMRWRMSVHAATPHRGRMQRVLSNRPGYVDQVVAELTERGPSTAGAIAEGEKRGNEHWGWNWTDAKTVLEWLFLVGRVSVASRVNFERVYDITDRVLPSEVLAAPTPSEDEARAELLLIAARCLGVATAADLADYFRQRIPPVKPILAELVAGHRLQQVQVEGWAQPAYLLPGTTIPRRSDARALLVPFDPLIWFRERVERIWGMRYRIEIYVPPAKRVHGYYVLPFLLGDALVARVDLKADRQSGLLRVQAAWTEPDAPDETAAELAAELHTMAEWLGLGGVAVTGPGDLAPRLAQVLA